MGLFSFIKTAGEKLFGSSETAEQQATKVKDHVSKYGFDLADVSFAVEEGKVKVTGKAKNIDEKQKILATAGNVQGIEGVVDELTLKEPMKIDIPDLSKMMYTVKSGDNLSKISKEVYGDPNKYQKIFDANKPMLSHPDKIYPGQVLYIPQE